MLETQEEASDAAGAAHGLAPPLSADGQWEPAGPERHKWERAGGGAPPFKKPRGGVWGEFGVWPRLGAVTMSLQVSHRLRGRLCPRRDALQWGKCRRAARTRNLGRRCLQAGCPGTPSPPRVVHCDARTLPPASRAPVYGSGDGAICGCRAGTPCGNSCEPRGLVKRQVG